MIYGLLLLFLLMWFLFIYMIIKGKRFQGFYYKGFASFMFILIFAYGVYNYMVLKNSNLNWLLIEYKYVRLFILIGLGLVSGLIGDLFLEIQYFFDKNRFYQITQGMIIFLIGHIFYILAMSFYIGFNYISLIIGLVMTALVYFGSKLMKIDFKSLKYLTYVYTFVIFTMVGLSVIQAIELSFNSYSLSFMIGALLFGISDLLLAPIYFQEQKGLLFPIANLATYYFGQLLIALSVLFL